MSATSRPMQDEVSIYALGTALLRRRWAIARWAFIGAVLAVAPILFNRAVYLSTASFATQASDASGRAGIASLAGQFGISLGAGNPGQSPDFYKDLLESRELLRPILRDTVTIPELGKTGTVMDLLGIAGSGQRREDDGIRTLQKMIDVSIARTTSVITVSVTSPWASLSNRLVHSLLDGVNGFNLRARQTQGAAERRFVESRLDVARAELAQAEERAAAFARGNRATGGSPNLTLERDRLQREVSMRQQVYTALMQSLEEARIREVRDTPLITVIESPSTPSMPEPRGRIRRAIIGLIVGAFVGLVLSILAAVFAAPRPEEDADAMEFRRAWNEMTRGVIPARWRDRSVTPGSRVT